MVSVVDLMRPTNIFFLLMLRFLLLLLFPIYSSRNQPVLVAPVWAKEVAQTVAVMVLPPLLLLATIILDRRCFRCSRAGSLDRSR